MNKLDKYILSVMFCSLVGGVSPTIFADDQPPGVDEEGPKSEQVSQSAGVNSVVVVEVATESNPNDQGGQVNDDDLEGLRKDINGFEYKDIENLQNISEQEIDEEIKKRKEFADSFIKKVESIFSQTTDVNKLIEIIKITEAARSVVKEVGDTYFDQWIGAGKTRGEINKFGGNERDIDCHIEKCEMKIFGKLKEIYNKAPDSDIGKKIAEGISVVYRNAKYFSSCLRGVHRPIVRLFFLIYKNTTDDELKNVIANDLLEIYNILHDDNIRNNIPLSVPDGYTGHPSAFAENFLRVNLQKVGIYVVNEA